MTPWRTRVGSDAFTAVYDGNNRTVQPLNDRECNLDETPEVAIRR